MLDLYDKITAAVNHIQATWKTSPRVGVILGTGLGQFAEQIEIEATFDYEAIPGFPKSTAISRRSSSSSKVARRSVGIRRFPRITRRRGDRTSVVRRPDNQSDRVMPSTLAGEGVDEKSN